MVYGERAVLVVPECPPSLRPGIRCRYFRDRSLQLGKGDLDASFGGRQKALAIDELFVFYYYKAEALALAILAPCRIYL